MHPNIWGKYAWNFLHQVTMAYPDYPTPEDKQRYYDFLSQLRYVLPCGKCRKNYADHLRTYPLTEYVLSSKNNLIKWGIDMHNIVNHYTGKRMIPYSEAMENLSKLSSVQQTSGNSTDYIYLALIFVAFAILCFIIWYVFFRKN